MHKIRKGKKLKRIYAVLLLLGLAIFLFSGCEKEYSLKYYEENLGEAFIMEIKCKDDPRALEKVNCDNAETALFHADWAAKNKAIEQLFMDGKIEANRQGHVRIKKR